MIDNPFIGEALEARAVILPRWVDGTITSLDPLLVKLDGFEEQPQPPTKPPLIADLGVGDRVMCLLHGRQLIIFGPYGYHGGGIFAGPIVINPKDLGATGDGVTDDWAPVQAAFAACKIMGGTVFFPVGTYRVSEELNIYGKTSVYATGATIQRAHNRYTIVVGDRGATYYGYDGNTDITWTGGTIDANADEFSGRGSTWTMSHCRNITMERVTFLDATSHAVECNAVYNGRFINCDFAGYRNLDANTYVEAIQLDIALQSGFSAYGAYDGTPCEHILVDDCVFRASANYSASPRGVGSHSGRIDAALRNITIRANRFINLESYAIRVYNWHGTEISGNYCTGGPFLLVNTPVVGDGTSDYTRLVDGTQTGASVSIGGVYVRNNEHRGPGSSVRIIGEPTGRVLVVCIEGNRFDNSYAGGDAIYIDYADGVTINGGEVYRSGGNGLFSANTRNLTVNGTVIDGANRAGILLQDFNAVTLSGVVTKNVSVSLSGGYDHVRLTTGGTQCTITGHIASNIGSAGTPGNGFSATSTVSRVTRVGCDWGGYGVNDTSSSPLVSAERA